MFKIGEEVEVSFIGQITEISLASNGAIIYKVDGKNKDRLWTTCYQLKENQLRPLLTPEMVGE